MSSTMTVIDAIETRIQEVRIQEVDDEIAPLEGERQRRSASTSAYSLGSENHQSPSRSSTGSARFIALTTSTFSCDIAYSDRPTASRAAALSSPKYVHSTSLPSLNLHTAQTWASTGTPLAFPRALTRTSASTLSPASINSFGSKPTWSPSDTCRSRSIQARISSRPRRTIGSMSRREKSKTNSGGISSQAASSPWLSKAKKRRAISTFSCDIARAVSRGWGGRCSRNPGRSPGLPQKLTTVPTAGWTKLAGIARANRWTAFQPVQ